MQDCFKTDTQIKTYATKAMSGTSFTLTDKTIDPWVLFEEGDSGIVEINDVCGTFEVTDEGIVVTFPSSVVIICGSCIYFEKELCECGTEPCYAEKIIPDINTKIAVLDDDLCPTKYFMLGDICEVLEELMCYKICKMLNDLNYIGEMPVGSKLVAVIPNGDCALVDPPALDKDPPDYCCNGAPCDPCGD